MTCMVYLKSLIHKPIFQFFSLFLALILSTNFLSAKQSEDTPTVKNGIIDLSNFTFTENIQLNGNWLFTNDLDNSKTTLTVPEYWHTI